MALDSVEVLDPRGPIHPTNLLSELYLGTLESDAVSVRH
jgi:hypothetical protein